MSLRTERVEERKSMEREREGRERRGGEGKN
jgi:hypothetical protein